MVKRRLVALAVAGLPPLLGVLTVTAATAIAAADVNLRRRHDHRAASPVRVRPA